MHPFFFFSMTFKKLVYPGPDDLPPADQSNPNEVTLIRALQCVLGQVPVGQDEAAILQQTHIELVTGSIKAMRTEFAQKILTMTLNTLRVMAGIAQDGSAMSGMNPNEEARKLYNSLRHAARQAGLLKDEA